MVLAPINFVGRAGIVAAMSRADLRLTRSVRSPQAALNFLSQPFGGGHGTPQDASCLLVSPLTSSFPSGVILAASSALISSGDRTVIDSRYHALWWPRWNNNRKSFRQVRDENQQ